MKSPYTLFLLGLMLALPVKAEQPQDFLESFSAIEKRNNPSFTGFDAQRGEQFFKTMHGGDWRCATCHTENPTAMGQHTVTKKDIKPLAPTANPERFTNASKVEKWFKRNCKDVLARECTAQEKGDVLTYLLSLKP